MTGVPSAVLPYDPFSKPVRTSDLPFLNVIDYGAYGNGVSDDTGAFVDAHSALPSGGGMILVPPGTYLVDGGEISITKSGVRLVGSGFGTTIKRGTDAAGTLFDVTGTSFSAADFILQDFSAVAANTAVSMRLFNINDSKIQGVWFQTGATQLFLDRVSNISIVDSGFEACRDMGARLDSASAVRLTGCDFYFTGAANPAAFAAILSQRAGGYLYRPTDLVVTGCTFEQGKYGHHIRLIEQAGATITGNNFSFAGILAPNTWDDIKLESCQWVVVADNTFPAEYDFVNAKAFGDVGYSRATRYCINNDAGCQSTIIRGNSFNPGMSGSVNDLSASTIKDIDLSTYADNAAAVAGGLPVNALYRITATDHVAIVH